MQFQKYKPLLLRKFDILSRGVKLKNQAIEKITNLYKIPTQRRTGASNGLDIYLGNNVYVNAPTTYEDIDKNTPYQLLYDEGNFFLTDPLLSSKRFPIKLIPQPHYYTLKTSSGEPLRSIGVNNIDRLAINLETRCIFGGQNGGCHYCSLTKNTKSESKMKQPGDIKFLVQQAFSDIKRPVRHIYITGGVFLNSDDFLKKLILAIKEIRNVTSAGIHAAIFPPKDIGLYQVLKDVGLNSIALNMEIYSQDRAIKLMKKKFEAGGGRKLIKHLELCVNTFPRDSVVSGLLAGLEPLKDTLKGVNLISSIGARPLLQHFRAVQNTPLSNHSRISAEEAYELLCLATDICESNGTGLSPLCEKCQHNIIAAPNNFIPSKNEPAQISYY